MIVAAIVAWAILAGAVSISFVYLASRRLYRRRQAAYREFLRDRGIEMSPDDTVKGAIIRAVPYVESAPVVCSSGAPMRPKARAALPRSRRDRTAFTDFNVPSDEPPTSPHNRSGFIELASGLAFTQEEPPSYPLRRMRKV